MSNTYTGNFSGYVVKTTPPVDATRKSSTLPKNSNYGVNQGSPIQQPKTTYGFREAIKTKATLFGTLLRPRKKKKKKTQDGDETTTLARPVLQKLSSSGQHNDTLNYDNEEVVSGRMSELIKLLVPTHDYYPNSNYSFTFILCSRLFMPPSTLLKQIREIVEKNIKENKEYEQVITKNFILLLVEWSENFTYDFKDKSMMAEFSRCSKLCININRALTSSVNTITKYLVDKFQELLQYVELSKEFRIQCDEEDKLLFDVCHDPLVFAQHLTILELEKMSKINPEQFVERFIKENITCSRLDLTQQTSTLELYVSWFNRLSYLVATEVCMNPVKKQRSNLINFFVEVGKQCFKTGNFNSLMAIIVGLNMNAVIRMKKTWQKSNQQGFRKLELEMSPEGNFHRYRETFKERLLSSGKNDTIIPVFSCLVKDIYFLNEGVKNRLPDNLINFQKFRQLSSQIKDIMELKNKKSNYKRNESIIDYLTCTPVCSDEGIYKSSFEVEPPDSNFERDRYRSVRIRVGNR